MAKNRIVKLQARHWLVLLTLSTTAGTESFAAQTTRFSYDAKGRLVRVESEGAASSTSTYTLDAADNRSKVVTNAKPIVLNASFEDPSLSSYAYTPSAPDLAFSNSAGISRNGDAWGFPSPWNGAQVAFLQGGGNQSGFVEMKAKNLVPGQRYYIAFAAAQRPGFPANNVKVDINGSRVWDAPPNSASQFNAYSTSQFTATATDMTIRFSSTPTSYDSASGIDSVSIWAA